MPLEFKHIYYFDVGLSPCVNTVSVHCRCSAFSAPRVCRQNDENYFTIIYRNPLFPRAVIKKFVFGLRAADRTAAAGTAAPEFASCCKIRAEKTSIKKLRPRYKSARAVLSTYRSRSKSLFSWLMFPLVMKSKLLLPSVSERTYLY